MVFRIGVDVPEVEVLAGEVAGSEKGGHHGVVLVVVFVHAIAANDLEVVERGEGVADGGDFLGVGGGVNGVGFGHANDAAIEDVNGLDEAELGEFAGAKSNEVLVGGVPEAVAFEAEVFESEAGDVGGGDHFTAPIIEVLNAAEFDGGVVDVDPVVREKVGLTNHEGDGEEVAVLKTFSGQQGFGGRGRVKGPDGFLEGHGDDKVIGFDAGGLTGGVADEDGGEAGVVVFQADDFATHEEGVACGGEVSCGFFPHHARAESGVLEGVDERFDQGCAGVFFGEEGVEDGGGEGESFDALGGPVGADFVAGHAPDFFGVGFKEDGEEPVSKAVGDPVGEGAFGSDGEEPGAGVAQDAEDGGEESEALEGVEGFEGVVKEVVVVEDAGEAANGDEVVGEPVVPPTGDFGGFAEEAVATDVEAKVFVADGAGNAADVVGIFFEDGDLEAEGGAFSGGGEAGGAGSDNQDAGGVRGFGWGAHPK